MVSEEQVFTALRSVEDPEIGMNIVDLGLVYEVQVQSGEVSIVYTLTSMGCPAGPLIDSDIRQSVSALEGVTGVKTNVVMQPPWGPEKMSDLARSALGFF